MHWTGTSWRPWRRRRELEPTEYSKDEGRRCKPGHPFAWSRTALEGRTVLVQHRLLALVRRAASVSSRSPGGRYDYPRFVATLSRTNVASRRTHVSRDRIQIASRSPSRIDRIDRPDRIQVASRSHATWMRQALVASRSHQIARRSLCDLALQQT